MRPIVHALLAVLALSAGPVAAEPASPVEVAHPRPAEAAGRLRLTGTVTAARHARLSPRESGLVAAVHVDAGSRAAEGDVLVELDRELAELELQAARAGLEEARARLAEARRLYEQAMELVAEQHIAETEVRARQASVQLNEAMLERLRAEVLTRAARVERHAVVAPFAGVVSRKLTETGEWVETGSPVVELVSMDDLRVDVQAPQERFGDLDDATTVTVRIDGIPAETFPGRVIAKVPVHDPTARTFLVRVAVTPADARMLPGMSADAEFHVAGAARALLVPRDAVVRAPDGTHRVWVIEQTDGTTTVAPRTIRIGRALGEDIEVLDGLGDGSHVPLPVVVRGNETLRQGQMVRIVGDATL